MNVIVDGIDVAVVLNTNFGTSVVAQAGITIAGATVALTTIGGKDLLKITSDSTGISSSIAIQSDSGVNAKALFGTGIAVSGTSSAETLTVTVDGTDVAVVLNTNFADVATAASGITIAGATIAVAE